jgi:hypothetical protein
MASCGVSFGLGTIERLAPPDGAIVQPKVTNGTGDNADVGGGEVVAGIGTGEGGAGGANGRRIQIGAKFVARHAGGGFDPKDVLRRQRPTPLG